LAAAYTGVEDIYWFVPVILPIQSVKDRGDKHTIGYSTNGSTFDSVLRALIAHYGLNQSGPDRRTARDVHDDNVGADRHRLVGSTVRAEGFKG
jgi:hypothetical protein